jgi:Protein of unknown function (DUF3108)
MSVYLTRCAGFVFFVTMPSAFVSPATRPSSAVRAARPRAWRWGTVVAAVLIVHGVVGTWIAHQREHFAPIAAKPPVEVVLLKPQRIERDAPQRPQGRPHERPNPARPAHSTNKPASAPSAQRVLQAVAPHRASTQALTDSVSPAPASAPAAVSGTEASAAAGTGNGSAKGNGAVTTAGTKAGGEPSEGIKFSTPPSGELRYDVFYNGMRNAPGTIRWMSDGNGYAIAVALPLPFVGTFTYESEGRIDAFGLAPQRYTEVRGRRGEDVTTFDRTARRIAFTRTTTTLALPDGAQDRFSVVMQLASLVRGDPDAYRPGVTRDFYVADNNSGEVWPMETVGDETVSTAAGFVSARHFMRLSRHAGDRRRLDVWLAPTLGWLPARIMQTEPNGTQIELVWGAALAPPGAENAQSLPADPHHWPDGGETLQQPARAEP